MESAIFSLQNMQFTPNFHTSKILMIETYPEVLKKIWRHDVIWRHYTSFGHLPDWPPVKTGAHKSGFWDFGFFFYDLWEIQCLSYHLMGKPSKLNKIWHFDILLFTWKFPWFWPILADFGPISADVITFFEIFWFFLKILMKRNIFAKNH